MLHASMSRMQTLFFRVVLNTSRSQNDPSISNHLVEHYLEDRLDQCQLTPRIMFYQKLDHPMQRSQT